MGKVDGSYAASEFWQAIVPAAGTNLVSNPSFEVATTGWAATSGAITRVAGGRFGAWCGSLLASAVNGRADFSLPQATAAQPVTLSAWVWADSPLVLLRLVQDSAVVEQAHPGDSDWHRIEVTATAASASTRSLRIIDTRTSGWTAVMIDGAQYEEGVSSATTYMDGDQDACTWTGTAGLSQSTRTGRDGRGGEIVSLESLGLLVMQNLGIGAPPVDIKSQEPAVADGELFQRQRNKPRVVTLMSMIEGTGGLAALHTIRRGLLEVFRPDARTGRGPVTLRYSGSEVPKLLPAYYTGGLEMDGIEAADEKIPLRLTALDPDFVGETEDSITLTGSQSVTVAKIAHLSADGEWSGLGGGIAGSDYVRDIVKLPDGRIVAGGSFVDMGGVSGLDYLAIWDGASWSQVGGVTPSDPVETLLVTVTGDLIVGGFFTNLNGNANADRVARYSVSAGTWSAMSTGVAYAVQDLIEDNDGLIWAFAVGSNSASYFNGSTWTVVSTGWPTGGTAPVVAEVGPDGTVFVAVDGALYSGGTAGWASHSTLAGPGSNEIWALKTHQGRLYAAGDFTAIGGVSANRIAVWNGVAWAPLGTGIAGGSTTTVTSVGFSPGGSLYAAGAVWTSAGGVVMPDHIAEWNGTAWLPFPANLPDTGTPANDVYQVFPHPDGSLSVSWYAGSGTFGTTLTAAGATTVTNEGTAAAYPIITISTTGLVYWLRNLTTGQTLAFSGLSGAINGTITLDFRPEAKTIRAGGFGVNLLSTVLAGSDLATFALAPGDNVIELFASGTTTAQMRWRSRFWSAD